MNQMKGLGPNDLRRGLVLVTVHLGYDLDDKRAERLIEMFAPAGVSIRREPAEKMLERTERTLQAREGIAPGRRYFFRGDGEDDPKGRELATAQLFADLAQHGYMLRDVALIARTEIRRPPERPDEEPKVEWHWMLRLVYAHEMVEYAPRLTDRALSPEQLAVIGPRAVNRVLEIPYFAFGQAHKNGGSISLFLRAGDGQLHDQPPPPPSLVGFMPGCFYLVPMKDERQFLCVKGEAEDAYRAMSLEWARIAPKSRRGRIGVALLERAQARFERANVDVVRPLVRPVEGAPLPSTSHPGDDRPRRPRQRSHRANSAPVITREALEGNPDLTTELLKARGFDDD